MCCLRISLPRSAIGCRRPTGPTRLGPWRVCMRPISLRSNTVMKAKKRHQPVREDERLDQRDEHAVRHLRRPRRCSGRRRRARRPRRSARRPGRACARGAAVPRRRPAGMPHGHGRAGGDAEALGVARGRARSRRCAGRRAARVRATAAPEKSGRRPTARRPSVAGAGAAAPAGAGSATLRGAAAGRRRRAAPGARCASQVRPANSGVAASDARERARALAVELEAEMRARRREHGELGGRHRPAAGANGPQPLRAPLEVRDRAVLLDRRRSRAGSTCAQSAAGVGKSELDDDRLAALRTPPPSARARGSARADRRRRARSASAACRPRRARSTSAGSSR